MIASVEEVPRNGCRSLRGEEVGAMGGRFETAGVEASVIDAVAVVR